MTNAVPVIAVVGLGGLGSAAAWYAARSGARVIGFEQFELGHVRGASHDHSRIIRRSYHTPHYVGLTAGAYDAWREVEAASRTELVTVTGGIDLFPPNAAIDPDTYRSSLTAGGVEHEWIGGDEIRRRWPAFHVDDDVMGIVQADTGIVPAGRGTATMTALAIDAGAELHASTPVLAIEPHGDRARIVTATGTHDVDRVIVTADAWTDRLLRSIGVDLALDVTREQVTYLRHPQIARMDDLPVWIWMDDPSWYGFPEYGHAGTIKVAEDCGGPLVDPDTRTFEPDADAESRLVAFTEGLLGGPVEVDHSVTCLYTLTSDRDFVADHVPGLPQVVVGLGAAHGFKFAPWFGRTLAKLAIDGGCSDDLSPFSLARPGLDAPADRSSWLV